MNRVCDHHFDKPTSVAALFRSRHGFWTWDMESGLISLDEHCCRILGLSLETTTLAYEDWLRRVDARDLLRMLPVVDAAIAGGESFQIEYSVVTTAEQWIWLETMGRVVEWRDGQPMRVAGIHTDISERIRAEQALAVSQARQQALIASLPDLVFVIDGDGLISEYYPPANSVHAFPPVGERIGQSYFNAFPPDIAHFITDSILVLIEDPTPLSADMSMDVGGYHRDLHITLSLLTDSNKWPVGYLGVARDITERKRIELALSRSEERLALVLKGSGGAAWDWDLQKGEFWHAPRWWNLLGYAAEETSRDPQVWCRYIHPEDAESAGKTLARALENPDKDSFSMDFRLCHRAGHYLRMVSRGHIQRDGNGMAVRVAGTSTVFTQRGAAR